MPREEVPFSIRLLTTRAAVGPDIEVIACGNDYVHFRFCGRLFLTRKGYRVSNYDSTVRHHYKLLVAGKLAYEAVCPRCKELVYGGA